MRVFWWAACILATKALAGPAVTAIPADEKFPAEVSIPNSRQVDFVSQVNGHRYRIKVALPFEAAPAKGYRILYVLDGATYFASATEAVRDWNAPGTVVVGIGYPDDPQFSRGVLAKRGSVPAASFMNGQPPSRIAAELERVYDLTLPASDRDLAAQSTPGYPKEKSEDVGGLDDFLKIIETEVKPRVAAIAPIDFANQALFGHSLGGLAVLHALLVEPNAFRTFIIASPSIWWNNTAVLAGEPKFAAAVSTGQASPRVLVTMGSMESTPPKFPASWGMDPAAIAAIIHKARMVENGSELVAWLKAVHGGPGYVVEDYAVFDKQHHTAAPWSALARGIPFAFSATP